MSNTLQRLFSSFRWWTGMPVAAPQLEAGTDESVTSFYTTRVTDCTFVTDPQHYEHPRARWLLDRTSGGKLLEIGCGNGGMTRELAVRVDSIVALDVSGPSLDELKALGLPNVETVEALLEHYEPKEKFDWIVMSEVVEHLRRPKEAISRCLGWLREDGNLLLTTPNGHWETDEHLQEFTLASFSRLIIEAGADSFSAGYLRDQENRRRWLVGSVAASPGPPAEDDFHDRWSTTRRRFKRLRS